MSLTDRDRKIALLLGPIVLVFAYWFLMLSPKRDEASAAADKVVVQEQRRDLAQQRADELAGAKTDFAADYTELVRLGKAVPASVDMPTLLVQLQAASQGTDIAFMSIATGERESAPVVAPQPPAAPGTGDGSQPAAAGGTPAQSAPGQVAETAGNTVAGANTASATAESGVSPADTATSTTAREGAIPIGGGAPATDAGTAVPGAAPGLESVPLDLEFTGNFFDLADFFHKLKRYVETSEKQVFVRGRLLTIDGFSFSSDPEIFPKLNVEITATAYLAPKAEGATAGATPGGPAAAPVTTEATSAPATEIPTATATR
jgi:Tfp pilus assembly protein PilO